MTTHNLSIFPYFDDYNESKGFSKILFRPSVGVQTRELNQLQSILQKQVSRIGDHLFQQGSMIIPGRTSYDLNVRSLKIAATYNSSPVDITSLIGRTLKCATTECEYEVITSASDPSNSTIKVLIVKLVKAGGIDRDVVSPVAGETLIDVLTVANVATVDTNAGFYNPSSIAYVDNGVYYINGYFVYVTSQILILSLYSKTPTAKVGLNVIESIITDVDDTSLLDPAFGSSNENAPGAHRLKIELIFTKVDINAPASDSFIELMDFVNGVLTFKKNKTEYAEVMKTLARRTYEESGNYTVKEFIPTLREHLRSVDGKNGGVYTAAQGGDASKFVIQLTPGIAFVKGYETETNNISLVSIPKARDTIEVQNSVIRPSAGNHFLIGNIVGFPNINTRPYVELRNNSSKGTSPSSYTVIGYAVLDNIEHYSGVIGSVNEIHKARVSQVKLTAGGLIKTIGVSNGGTGYVAIPAVSITGDGVGATATATIAGGKVTGINVNTQGSGYTYATITIAPPASGANAQAFAQIYYFNVEDVGSMVQVNLAGTIPFSADVIVEYTISNNTGTFVADQVYTDVSTSYKTKVHSWDALKKLLWGIRTGNTIDDEPFNVGMVISNGTVSGTVVDKIVLKDPTKNDLIFDMSFYPVKTLFNTNNVTDIEYIVNREVVLTLDANGAGTIVAGANESISTFNSADFIARITASGAGAGTYIGPIDLTNYIVTSNPLSYPITLGTDYQGDTLKIIVPFKKLIPSYRTKTLVANSELVIASANLSSYISLQKSDIYRVVGIWQKNDVAALNTYADIVANPAYYKDIKYQFVINDGQRDSYITHGSITLNQNAQLPTDDVIVVFDYFTSGAGEFFCVDSYTSIPSYLDLNPRFKSVSSGNTHQLYSAIDFRPVALPTVHEFSCNITNTSTTLTLDGSSGQSTTALSVGQTVLGQGIPIGTTIASITNTTQLVLSAAATVTRNKVIVIFGGESGTLFLTKFKESIDYGQSNIKLNSDFRTDLQYFVPRLDSLYLTSNSTFEWVKGTAGSTPNVSNKAAENKMRLMDLNIPAYTFDVKLISVKRYDNPGYTMDMISKIEKRVENLEQYTALTLLEKQTKDQTIVDPATGLDRMKLGIGADNFKDNALADLKDSEYHAAMDKTSSTCGAPVIVNQIGLVKSATSANITVIGSHDIKNGAVSNPTLAMLPYTEVEVLSQKSASETKNINPFTTTLWHGKMRIHPEVDIWTDIGTAPDIIVAENFKF
jgi:hypothetical protein